MSMTRKSRIKCVAFAALFRLNQMTGQAGLFPGDMGDILDHMKELHADFCRDRPEAADKTTEATFMETEGSA